MRIGISTSVIQRGRSGVGQYVLALVRALLPEAGRHEFTLFVLEEDIPLFEFAREAMRIVPVSERFRPAVKNIAWHQTELHALVKSPELTSASVETSVVIGKPFLELLTLSKEWRADLVVVGVSPPGDLIAFDLSTGMVLHSRELSAGRGGGFAISEGHVLIGTGFTFFAWSDEPLNGALQVFEVQ